MMKPFPKNPFAFLWHYALKNKALFLAVCSCGALSIVLAKLSPYFFSKMIALFEKGKPFEQISHAFWGFLTAVLVATILSKTLETVFSCLAEIKLCPKIYKQISLDCFNYINGHSVSYFADNMAGALAQKGNSLAQNAGFYISLLYYLGDVFQLFVIFVMLAGINVKFALCFAAFIVLSVLVLMYVGKFSVNLRAKMVEEKNKVAGQMIDALQNQFFVRLFNGADYEKNRAVTQMDEEVKITNKSVNIEVVQSKGENLYFQIVSTFFLIYSFYLWKNSAVSSADVVLIFFLLQNVSGTVAFLIHRGIVYSGIFADIRTNLIPFACPHDIQDKPDAAKLEVTDGKIELKHVSFAYNHSEKLFDDFNLTVPAGQKIGIVGMSGGGKSTLINLIQRFYDIDNGEILIDGQNIQDVTQESLHKAIGYVPQSSSLLERSVAENISYGRSEASINEIKDAARKAYADEFIRKLPQGYRTVLNAKNQLSGGQIQRLAIARVLLKNSKILILDEATSSLDSESEFYIGKAVENMLLDKTVLVVAHRLSTLKNMDRIIVLEKGKVVEDGTLEDLLALKGSFYQYWMLQKLKGGDDEK